MSQSNSSLICTRTLNMSYDEYVLYLKCKYGSVPYDYFTNENCKSKNNKNTRTSDGLYIHHVDENHAILLSTPDFAKIYPFNYQKAERLVYCDAIEHLLLHVKIVQESDYRNKLTYGIGGAEMLWRQLNGWFQRGYVGGWKKNIFAKVKEQYVSYIFIMRCVIKPLVDSDEQLSQAFQKPALALDWNGAVMQKLYKDIYSEW